MANEEQLAILRQGVEVWNKWKRGKWPRNTPVINIDIPNTYLYIADLRGADLSSSNLSYADFSLANLSGAVLRETNLTWSDLGKADLQQANLMRAVLRNADLRGVNFTRAHLNECEVSDAILGGTIFAATDLSEVKGLDTLHHAGPSFIGIETIYQAKGCISDVFLRGCGLSDLDIEYAKLANPGLDPEQVTDITYKIHQLYLGGGIRYFSCFVSYSSRDQEFAQRLHDDLQDNGVRCWFAPEDMKIGDQIRPRIDQEIRLRDKLLVILSENSVKSKWVGDEVEGALEEEGQSNRLVLFPIRLDDAVMNTRDDWAAKIKRRRHIGDFLNWKDKANYQKAFERLLRDLKATGGERPTGVVSTVEGG